MGAGRVVTLLEVTGASAAGAAGAVATACGAGAGAGAGAAAGAVAVVAGALVEDEVSSFSLNFSVMVGAETLMHDSEEQPRGIFTCTL